MAAKSLQCKECRTPYPLEARYVCEQCFGPLEVTYDHERIDDVAEARRRIQGGPQNIWRYADFLPLEQPPASARRASSLSGLPAGCTPLIRADRLAERLGLGELWIKNDAANPTHSFKDRVVSVAVARARELGYEVIACASTGILANSVAAHGAALGLESYVFIPADLEEQKVLATGVYGTHVVAVRGNYDAVNRLCTELSGERDWAFVNVNMRPYYAEGSKTLAYEIAEQLGWRTPDRVVAPIASPADGPYALDAARSSGGAIDAVDDDEIRAGIRLLAETTGIFTETAGGVTTATLAKLAERGDIAPDERVVLVITGDGLKTLDAVRDTFTAHEIDASFDQFVERVEQGTRV